MNAHTRIPTQTYEHTRTHAQKWAGVIGIILVSLSTPHYKTLLQCDEGTTVINGEYSGVAERIYHESIKITQKLVYAFYIYCNIEPRTCTT